MQETSTTLMETLLACETAVWDALVSGDTASDAAALDDLFLGVYPDGFADKNAHVEQLANGPTIRAFALSQARVMPFGDQFALLSYCAEYQRVGVERTEQMYVSSIWKREGTGWVGVFSQDTPAVMPDRPAPQ